MRLFIAVSAVIGFWLSAANAVAKATRDLPTYQLTVAGGRFVFVMHSKQHPQDPNLLALYPVSGMYKNDGSHELLWAVDWYSDPCDLVFANDGIHLIRFDRWWPYLVDERKADAVSFLANGKILHAHSKGELIVRPELVTLRGHSSWIKKTNIDEGSDQVGVVTEDEQRIAFDLTTGEILSRVDQSAENRLLFYYGIGGTIAGAILVLAVWYRLSGRRIKMQTPMATAPAARFSCDPS